MATWKIFITFFLIAAFDYDVLGIKRDLLDTDQSRQQIHGQNLLNNEPPSFSKHHLSKRSIGESSQFCDQQDSKFTQRLESLEDNSFVVHGTLVNDTNKWLALAFLENKRLVVATSSQTIPRETKLHFSKDDGRNFEDIHGKIQNEQIQMGNGLQEHPRANKMNEWVPSWANTCLYWLVSGMKTGIRKFRQVYVLTNTGEESHLWISRDTDTDIAFDMFNLPFVLMGTFIYHPFNGQYIMALANKELWVSEDGGKTWKSIATKVQNAKWSPDEQYQRTIFASISLEEDKFDFYAFFGLRGDIQWEQSKDKKNASDSYDNDLRVTTNMDKNWKTIREHIYSFGIQDTFMFVSVFLDSEMKEEGERILEVTTRNHKTYYGFGAGWAEVQLPSITPEQFYSILDMSEGSIFLHVDTPGDTGEGTLYISDQSGIIYSESLRRHLYPNFEDLTDFYQVDSMRGVYITSQLEEDNGIHTMITYNRGAEWKLIERPHGVACNDETKACSLQIHNVFSQQHDVLTNRPLSAANAPGIILVHGIVADNMKKDLPHVFVSRDGGYTWNETTLEGPHHYQIADQGGILVAVPLEPFPKVVKFSTDEGMCWHEYTFTEDDVHFTGLLADPGNEQHTVAIWGSDADSHWHVYVIDFSEIITETCTKDDFRTWYPHWDMLDTSANEEHRGCLLGKKEQMQRLKKESWCLINGDYKIKEEKQTEICSCTKADFDCDYGYRRVGSSDNCVEDNNFKGKTLDICERGHEKEIVSIGYRKIPGDQCKDGFMPSESLVDLHKVCEEGDRSLLEKQMKSMHSHQAEKSENQYKIVGKSFLLGLIGVLLLMAVLMALYMTRKVVKRRRAVRYRYSLLQRNDYGTDLKNAVATNTSLYDDDSDEETRDNSTNGTFEPDDTLLMDHVSVNQNGGPPHAAPITTPTSSSNQPPKQPNKQLSSQAAGVETKSYHDDSDVDLLN